MEWLDNIEENLGRRIKILISKEALEKDFMENETLEGELRGFESPNDNEENEYGLFIENDEGDLYLVYESEIKDLKFII